MQLSHLPLVVLAHLALFGFASRPDRVMSHDSCRYLNDSVPRSGRMIRFENASAMTILNKIAPHYRVRIYNPQHLDSKDTYIASVNTSLPITQILEYLQYTNDAGICFRYAHDSIYVTSCKGN